MSPADVPDLAINTATTRKQWRLDQAIEGYARAGISAIGPWREEIQEMGVQKAARQIRDAGLIVTGLCRAGMLTARGDAEFKAALDDNRRAIEEAHGINATHVVIVAGGLPPGSKDLKAARDRVAEGLSSLRADAEAAGIRLALEPLNPIYGADRSVIVTLDQALDICEAVDVGGTTGLGVIVDTYHVWWDPNLSPALSRAAPKALGFHVNDWLSPQTDPLNDRGMIGDGAIDLPEFTKQVRKAGITLTPEVEIFSDRWWSEQPEVVVQTCIDRWRIIMAEANRDPDA